MKYYINFIITAGGNVSGIASDYRFPTDLPYKQTGVYNQKCKYKLSSFMLLEPTEAQMTELDGATIVLRINNSPSMNIFTLSQTNTRVQRGLRPIEFHLRNGYDYTDASVLKRNSFAFDSLDEEYVGQPLWGQVPDITINYYTTTGFETNFLDISILEDLEVAFTLEVEPIALRL